MRVRIPKFPSEVDHNLGVDLSHTNRIRTVPLLDPS